MGDGGPNKRGEMIDLSGRRALVTGGSRGIGRATAIMLARAGSDVGIGYHVRQGEARETVAELERLGAKAWAEAGDLGTSAGAAQLFERCDREFDGLDIFVANAGIWNVDYRPFAELEYAEWKEMMAANLDSVYHTTRAAAQRLGPGGKIVIVSSTAGQRGEDGHAHYAATKGAVISLVKSLAVELGPRDINVNAVAPGWVDTDMARPALQGENEEAVLGDVPLGRIASADEVAGPILFLCCPLARHITGEVLNVNGGSVLCG